MQADIPVAPPPPAPPIYVDGQLSRARLLQRVRQRRYRALQAVSSTSPAALRSPLPPASAPGHKETGAVLLTASPLTRCTVPLMPIST